MHACIHTYLLLVALSPHCIYIHTYIHTICAARLTLKSMPLVGAHNEENRRRRSLLAGTIKCLLEGMYVFMYSCTMHVCMNVSMYAITKIADALDDGLHACNTLHAHVHTCTYTDLHVN